MSRHCWLGIVACCLLPVLLAGCTPGNQPPAADAFSGDVGGCGDFYVYRYSADHMWMLTVTVNRTALPGREFPDMLDVAANADAVKVEVLRLASASEPDPCGCIGGEPPLASWQAISGTLAIQAEDMPKSIAAENYRVSVQLEGLKLEESDSGRRAALNPVEISGVVVGWFAG